MKEKFIENGIEYVRNGDYYIPNLTVPDDKVYNIGKYGRLSLISTPKVRRFCGAYFFKNFTLDLTDVKIGAIIKEKF